MAITVCLLEANEANLAIFWKREGRKKSVHNRDLNNQQLLANPLPRGNGTPQSYDPLSSDSHLWVSLSVDSRCFPGHINGSKRLRTELYRSVIDKNRHYGRKDVRSDATLEERSA